MNYDAERDAIAEREELEALARAVAQQKDPMERAGQRHARYGMGGRGNAEDFARVFKAHHAANVQPSLFTKEKTQ